MSAAGSRLCSSIIIVKSLAEGVRMEHISDLVTVHAGR